jgi:hypothetical protein
MKNCEIFAQKYKFTMCLLKFKKWMGIYLNECGKN